MTSNPSKSIESLVPDIYTLVDKGTKIDEEGLHKAVHSLAAILRYRLGEDREKSRSTLRMSNIGSECDRKLWYQVNTPDAAEPLPPNVRIKFLYGDLIEWLILYLAELAGHKVEGEQDELKVGGIVGHRDAIIDGVLVDVKSANSRSFDKFKYHKLEQDDPFNYLYQLSLYLEGSKHDENLKVKKEGAFLAVDKEMGHIVLDKYKKLDINYDKFIAEKKDAVAGSEPPRRRYMPIAYGKSGNYCLDTACNYCPFKQECWSDSNGGKGLRSFLYSNKIVHMTKVDREPDVPEIK